MAKNDAARALSQWKRSVLELDVAHCDICYRPFKDGDLVVDTKTSLGPWGHLCTRCALVHGTPRLGTIHERRAF